MPKLVVDNFNIVCATLGGFITLFGLVSYLLKEKFYLSEAFISTFAGLAFSPHATNWIRPLEYAGGNEEHLETITLYFSRLVLGVQLVLAGVQLPSKYLQKEWKTLSWLLGPGMCAMWMCTSLLVWAMVPSIPFVYALAIGSCVTPTDPVLSNSIVKGKFADKNIPSDLQKIIIAESGANDGLGYPFLFIALYLIKFTHHGGEGTTGGAAKAMGLWFGITWGYTILLSIVYGAVVGYVAKQLLHWAEDRRYVDRESFLVFAITLALFIVGTVGMIGSDDVLACFIAGNVFTWDDWFRLETQDDSLQPTIDMLLNVSVFMWYGAVCPWHSFVANNVIPIYRLAPLGLLVLLFRRLPFVLLFHKLGLIRQIEDIRHALFVGFFGPIGVSAVFYLYISREFLHEIIVDGEPRHDAEMLAEMIDVVVWFLIICSIVVHGLSVPLGKLGFYLPRTISTAISTERISASQSMARSDQDEPASLGLRENLPHSRPPGVALHRRLTTSERGDAISSGGSSKTLIPRSIARAAQHIWDDIKRPHGTTVHGTEDGIRPRSEDKEEEDGSPGSSSGDREARFPSISGPIDGRVIGRAVNERRPEPLRVNSSGANSARRGQSRTPASAVPSRVQSPERSGTNTPTSRLPRAITFADERTRHRDRSKDDGERGRAAGGGTEQALPSSAEGKD